MHLQLMKVKEARLTLSTWQSTLERPSPNEYHQEEHQWQLSRKLLLNYKRCKIKEWYKPQIVPGPAQWYLYRKKMEWCDFFINYRQLNNVTKPDVFPLPRIVDLLDQLGKAQFFSTLDLAAGYWQVQMHPESRENMAFNTNFGLFEFRVMPFGLRNAPAVFQCLMQYLLSGLNPHLDLTLFQHT